MPKFPKREADILALCEAMIAGYLAHPADFPSRTPGPLLVGLSGQYFATKNTQTSALAAAQIATEQKDDKLDALIEAMKNELKKSEVDAAGDPQKLEYIGWGPKAPPTPTDPPGQPRNLVALNQGTSSVTLDWKPTANGSGGPVRTYVIERRKQPQGGGDFSNWLPVGSALETKATLTGQPRGVQLEYRLKAINTGGESVPSNTAAVVL